MTQANRILLATVLPLTLMVLFSVVSIPLKISTSIVVLIQIGIQSVGLLYILWLTRKDWIKSC